MKPRRVSEDRVRAAVSAFLKLDQKSVVVNAAGETADEWLEPIRSHLHRTGLASDLDVRAKGRDVFLFRKP